jgi:hypothetical protein
MFPIKTSIFLLPAAVFIAGCNAISGSVTDANTTVASQASELLPKACQLNSDASELIKLVPTLSTAENVVTDVCNTYNNLSATTKAGAKAAAVPPGTPFKLNVHGVNLIVSHAG